MLRIFVRNSRSVIYVYGCDWLQRDDLNRQLGGQSDLRGHSRAGDLGHVPQVPQGLFGRGKEGLHTVQVHRQALPRPSPQCVPSFIHCECLYTLHCIVTRVDYF